MSVEANVFCFSRALSLSRCSWKSAIFVVSSTADELSVELDAPEFLSDSQLDITLLELPPCKRRHGFVWGGAQRC